MCGLLVAAVSISALSLMGNSLGNTLSALIADLGGSGNSSNGSTKSATGSGGGKSGGGSGGGATNSGGPGITPPAEAAPPPPSATGPLPKPLGPATAYIQLADGTNIALSAPTDLARSIETLGANGTTLMLAQSLHALGQQLLEQGKITQAGANALSALANQGHQIAAVESAIESVAAQSGGDVDAFRNTPVTYNGQTYANGYELSVGLIGTTNGSNGYEFAPEVDKFWSLYSDLWGAGVMNDPGVKELVAYHVQTIHNIADNTRVVGYNMLNHNTGTPDQFNEINASKYTNNQSASICNLGGGLDSGVSCP